MPSKYLNETPRENFVKITLEDCICLLMKMRVHKLEPLRDLNRKFWFKHIYFRNVYIYNTYKSTTKGLERKHKSLFSSFPRM